jgi:hypothetical protein
VALVAGACGAQLFVVAVDVAVELDAEARVRAKGVRPLDLLERADPLLQFVLGLTTAIVPASKS